MNETKKKVYTGARVSFYFGLFFWLPLLGILLSIVAIVSGIIAVVKTSKNKTLLRGRGIAIAGIVLGIAGFAFPAAYIYFYVPKIQHAQVLIVQSQETLIAIGLSSYYSDNGTYPSTKEGLEALFVRPDSEKNWKGPYLDSKDMLIDPWGNKYRYKSLDKGEKYKLYSLGKDGIESRNNICYSPSDM